MSKMKRHMEELYLFGRRNGDVPHNMDFETWQIIFLSGNKGEEE